MKPYMMCDGMSAEEYNRLESRKPKMKYRVLRITNNVEEYPENDNEEFPHIVRYVEDEFDLFIVDETGHFYPARDFFYMNSMSEFQEL